MTTSKHDVTITLTREQLRELTSVLWEMCAETDDGIKFLREDLPLSDVYRIFANAYIASAERILK